MYLLELDHDTGELTNARLVPMQMRRFRLERTPASDAKWLCNLLNEHGGQFGTVARLEEDETLTLQWPGK
jgi:poly-gamma-glutamate synthesis protein (capsule biosynthesis protein)